MRSQKTRTTQSDRRSTALPNQLHLGSFPSLEQISVNRFVEQGTKPKMKRAGENNREHEPRTHALTNTHAPRSRDFAVNRILGSTTFPSAVAVAGPGSRFFCGAPATHDCCPPQPRCFRLCHVCLFSYRIADFRSARSLVCSQLKPR